MQITDSLGGVITITDLKASIALVAGFMTYRHEDTNTYPSLKRFDERRYNYWKDIHEKLLQLQTEAGNPE
jgi:hypothetical protein